MTSPVDPPDGNWWNQPINRREGLWLGLGGLWSIAIFGWMSAFTRIGDQNPIGETHAVSPDEFRDEMDEYQEAATDDDDGLVPPGDEVYIGAQRFDWDGTPVVLETDREYDFHFSAYDVQHGFSLRPSHTLSKQMNLQIIPGYEWVLPMTFDESGTYHIICNEFCGVGHRTMHGQIVVRDP